MPININVYIFIPLVCLPFEEEHYKADLVHVLIKCFPMIVKLRFDVQNKALKVISISIKGSDIQLIRLMWPLLLLFQSFQLFLQPLDLVGISLVGSFAGGRAGVVGGVR